MSQTVGSTWSTGFNGGDLVLHSNGRYLQHVDGAPFFYMADTAWELFTRLTREETEMYLENRRQKGFTAIQAVILSAYGGTVNPNAYGHPPVINGDVNQPNEPFFEHVDYVVNRAQAKGIYLAVLPTWGNQVTETWGAFNPQNQGLANAYNWGKYISNRYRDVPNIIWVLGGDTIPTGFESVWREMARGLTEGDCGKHLMTFHPQGINSSSAWFHNDTWLDFNMLQSAHHFDHDNYNMIANDYNLTPAKPTIDGEPRYETIPSGFNPANGRITDFDVRQAEYWALFAGAHGITYGHNSVWQMYAPGRNPAFDPIGYWYDSLDAPGASHMSHIRTLIEGRPFFTRIPDQSVIAAGQVSGAGHMQATRSSDGSYAFLYTPLGDTVTVDMTKISGGTVKTYWYNPREGTSTLIGQFPNSGTRSFTPPSSGRGNDWVLVLDDATKNFPPPGHSEPTPEPGKPIIELLFNENGGTATANTGTSSSSYPQATLTANRPLWTANAAPSGGQSALDFGTVADRYAIDLTGQIEPLKGLKSFTITGWVNNNSAVTGSGGNRIVSWINNGGEGVDLVYVSSGALQLGINQWPDGSPAISSGGQIPTDANASAANWRFFAVTYDAALSSAQVKFYFGAQGVDATLDVAKNYSRGMTGSNIGPALTVGHFNSVTRHYAPDRMFRGIIDQIRVFGSKADSLGALSLAEIVQIQFLE
ncbi:apiosidase-like domain-containing protein [Numidum massiliense]|uniref:apiosidase-like domain-containing protein n=1 Tax=Numidum massiliense TaxID=1522315 RepID=UPI0006D54F64|nr:DUF4038 domain-containing protein [Numidum massiliense]